MKIVPALLTNNKEELKIMLRACAGFTDYVQIDIMDGKFVPSESVTLNDIAGLSTRLKTEAHLMVEDPLAWLKTFKEIGSRRIIFHFEIKKELPKIIKAIKEEKMEVGLAVNPATQIKDFEFLLDKVDTVLFLSVNPGFYGAQFIPEVLEKIKKFRELYPKKITGIDGGIKLDNVLEVAKTGLDYICIGSAILKSKDPAKTYAELKKIAK